MFWKFLFGENWIGWGWLSLILIIPYAVVSLFLIFDWGWLAGFPISISYLVSILIFPLMPILIFLQCVVIAKERIKDKSVRYTNLILLIVSTSLFVFSTRAYWIRLFSS